MSCAKARVLWLLEWKALREAGFTEQRKLPPLGSGRITGCCLVDPIWFHGPILLGQSLFNFC
ncbi:hypothetical protein ES319_A11G055500v1 [Gossypium barbadense]|uniref:Uncharacterized protein n=1 Tax=Gossypium barbadense TaxID=3634 RepID=A0A5J5TJF0_GOSBA|nr:hypothetical protein ES319_A11G055500v1 [Gossypium barbadense]